MQLVRFSAIVLSLVIGGVVAAQTQQTLFSVSGNYNPASSIPGEQLGSSVAAVGDITGDGIPDIIAGAPQAGVVFPPNTFPTSQAGRARLFDGATGTPMFVYDGTANGGFFGRACVGLGDVNGDGLADFAIGAGQIALPPLPTGGSTPPSYVRVCSGGVMGAYLYTITSPNAAGDLFGQDLAAGDLTNDGIKDLVVGARNISTVYVYDGATQALLRTIVGPPSTLFGSALAVIGDVNGDGYADILVGARSYAVGAATTAGYAAIFDGFNGSTIAILTGTATADIFGTGVAATGDLDQDGVPDFAVGAPRYDFASVDAGRVTAYSGLTRAPLWTKDGEATTDFLGIGLAGGGDVDQDGMPDVLAGGNQIDDGAVLNTGGVLALAGGDGHVLGRIKGLGLEDRIGVQGAFAYAGDMNGDGFPDILIGDGRNDPAAGTDAGTVYVRSFGKYLGPHAAGAVETLVVNGSTGDMQRRVDIGFGTPVAITMQQPSTNPAPAPFLLFGALGVATGQFGYTLPFGLGTMCFTPSLVAPGTPGLFMLFDSVTPGNPAALVPGAGPAPYTYTNPGLAFPIDVTLQGIVFDTPSTVARTNAVLVTIH